MFAYCGNNPVRYSDPSGNAFIEAIIATIGVKWTVTIIIGGIVIVSGLIYETIETVINWLSKQWYQPFAKISYAESGAQEETIPDVTYPGDDPKQAPEGYTWQGKGEQGSSKGNYYNKDTTESLHPDLNHPEPTKPHWDYNYRGSGCKGWRIFADGTIEKKLMIVFAIMAVEWWEEYGK